MMPKFNVDYSGLAQIQKKAYRLSDVKDQLETVAFDVVRFKDGDKGADLWQIQSADDGDYIVALYDADEENEKTASAKNPWDVFVTKNGHDLQISYKGDPLVRMASAKLGIPSSELHKAEQYLPEKLATNKKLVKALLSQLSETARLEVSKRYPELV
ncbi:MAG: hypothetical protein HC877_23905 [Thioploca sp.]|nr:hypothetical protein [Thioploca sp.]